MTRFFARLLTLGPLALAGCTTAPIAARAPIAAFEHADPARSSLFPATPGVRLWTGQAIARDTAARTFPGAYNLCVDAAGDLYVLEGAAPAQGIGGAAITKVDGDTLTALWRTPIEPTRRVWTYPGVVGLDASGGVLVVNGTTFARLDAATGTVLARTDLPDRGDPDNAAYNGYVVLPDGVILAKSFFRAAGCQADGFQAFLQCPPQVDSGSDLVLLHPQTLDILWSGPAPERIGGRVSAWQRDGRTLVYLAGRDALHRLVRMPEGGLAPDPDWGPVPYRGARETPGTAPVRLGDFVLIQPNARLSPEPYRLLAVHQDDPAIRFEARPFADVSPQRAFIPSKPSVDEAASRVYVVDGFGGTAALDFDPARGFTTAWRDTGATSLNFTSLTGPPDDRLLAATAIDPQGADIPRMAYTGEAVVLRRASDGVELARSPRLDPAPGLNITPAANGSFVFLSLDGALERLRPEGK